MNMNTMTVDAYLECLLLVNKVVALKSKHFHRPTNVADLIQA
jgi:hypothetical protein